VGDEKVTAGELDHLLNMVPPQYRNQMRGPGRRQFADNVVRILVMAQEGKRHKLDQSEAYKAQMAFQSEQLLAQMYYQDLTTNLKPDEAAERAYYDAHKSDYTEVKASHILIKFKNSAAAPAKDPKDAKDAKDQKELTEEEALAKANDIRKKLLNGADFAALAKTDSDDTASGAKGGDLGTFGHGRMTPPFEQAAFTIPVGQISELVKSQFGYHIIKVETRQEKTFTDVRQDVERKLSAEMVKKTMDDLKTSAQVVMDPEYFGPAPAAPVTPGAPQTPAPATKPPSPQGR
jgi:parvulin-like peptidyl-prolyl isomerase